MGHSPSSSSPRPLSWPEVCARRLERHYLSESALARAPATVVGAICGAHAQVLSAAELSVGLRIPGVTREAIQHALWEERSLIKTYGPRGTVHLLPTQDLPLWIGALSALPPTPNPFPEGVRLTQSQTDELIAVIAELLAEAELTAEELTEAIVVQTGSWAGELVIPAFGGMWPRWRQVMGLAAHRGALCFGPNRGRAVTYTSPQRWLPGLQPSEARPALAALVQRYLYAYGPATPRQFAQWLAVAPSWATTLFDSLREELQLVDVEGERAWVGAGDSAAPASAPKALWLLPYFDAYVVGSHPRERLFPGPAAARALAGGQAGNYPVLLVDGEVAGVWHQRRSGRQVVITVEPLIELNSVQRRVLDEQASRVAAFLGGTPVLSLGPVAVGPHA